LNQWWKGFKKLELDIEESFLVETASETSQTV